jgi:hypothetical protein
MSNTMFLGAARQVIREQTRRRRNQQVWQQHEQVALPLSFGPCGHYFHLTFGSTIEADGKNSEFIPFLEI